MSGSMTSIKESVLCESRTHSFKQPIKHYHTHVQSNAITMLPFLVRHVPYFQKREAAKQTAREARWDAIKCEQRLRPTIRCGSSLVVNPFYKGPNPYDGLEVRDPRNRGNRFIIIRSENDKPIFEQSAESPNLSG